MDAKRPTMHDVAHVAGVSKSLVSRVLRGDPGVSAARRAKVVEAVKQLGYETNWAARSLSAARSARTKIVGVLVRDNLHPWSVELSQILRPLLEDAGYSVLMSLAPTLSSSRQFDVSSLKIFRDLRVDGLVVFGTVADEQILTPLLNEFPTIFVGTAAPSDSFDSVDIDDAVGMELMVKHLVDLGHTSIAFIDVSRGGVPSPRHIGYSEAMTRRGLRTHVVSATQFSIEGGRAAATRLFSTMDADAPTTAVVCADDLTAIGSMAAADELGVRVAIAGCDDIEIASLPAIELTSVHVDNATVAQLAAETLIARMEGDNSLPRQQLVTPRIIVRASTARETQAVSR